MQRELLDRQSWTTRQELANAIFERIEAWYNRADATRPLATCPPIDYERHHTGLATAA